MTQPLSSEIVRLLDNLESPSAATLSQELIRRGRLSLGTDTEFCTTAFHLWERIRVDDLTVLQYAGEEEVGARDLQATIERVSADAMADLRYLVARRLSANE